MLKKPPNYGILLILMGDGGNFQVTKGERWDSKWGLAVESLAREQNCRQKVRQATEHRRDGTGMGDPTGSDATAEDPHDRRPKSNGRAQEPRGVTRERHDYDGFDATITTTALPPPAPVTLHPFESMGSAPFHHGQCLRNAHDVGPPNHPSQHERRTWGRERLTEAMSNGRAGFVEEQLLRQGFEDVLIQERDTPGNHVTGRPTGIHFGPDVQTGRPEYESQRDPAVGSPSLSHRIQPGLGDMAAPEEDLLFPTLVSDAMTADPTQSMGNRALPVTSPAVDTFLRRGWAHLNGDLMIPVSIASGPSAGAGEELSHIVTTRAPLLGTPALVLDARPVPWRPAINGNFHAACPV
ncbi:uncharacterized protein N7482_009719 [Penicillium canariense]|uniref:Uncharacterized protein n=1 Tax=Penicillium canariense TaxID=189055 RepID=A0A9W9HRU2_9EURO|nr:uncharacterized protein N7482_009719 [Penicillium canariense]KAJ5153241.1 hypothetical protein N7482_009719 [Penicillium canariense]